MDYLIVGLGNIGAEYAATRHNMGFMVLDAFAKASNAVFETKRYGDVTEVSFKGRHLTLLKPSTYMNLSGSAVRFWMNKYSFPLENLLVISDDINLPFGTIRMRTGGSAGGHNGLKNIEECLETDRYARIRIGIGHQPEAYAQTDWVLGHFSFSERTVMAEAFERAAQAAAALLTQQPEKVMSTFNAAGMKEQ